MRKFAPAFPVSDLPASLAHYRLGFTTSEYSGDSAAGGYGFARRDGVELQLGTVPTRRTTSPTTAYLYVDDADALAAEWHETGADVRTPEDTPWGRPCAPSARPARPNRPAMGASQSRLSTCQGQMGDAAR